MRICVLKRFIVAVLVLFASILFAGIALAGPNHRPYQRVVVFGDSLSDPGNAFVLLRQVERPPFPLIPDAPYARGGLHFSNGKTWVEQMADEMGLSVSVGPA